MRRSTTVGLWARREAVLVSALAAGAALAVLATPLGIAWLTIAGAAVAAAGASARTVIAVRRSRLEDEIERAELSRLLRAEVKPVSEIDPTSIGIDRAEQTILGGGAVPRYQPRLADDALRGAVAGALNGSGPWIVIVNGPSKVGKSRSLFEALLECSRATALELVAPVDAAALKTLLRPGLGPQSGSVASVLWLDDLEPFLNAGATWQTLREWHAGAPSRIVAATYGGKGSDQIADSRTGGLATIASELQGHAREVTLGATTKSELAPLRSQLDAGDIAALERHGLAAYLVAGPALERKLSTARHAPGDDPCPEGVAVVDAAVDWARCGRTDPIPPDTLQQLWPSFLPDGGTFTDDRFEKAMDWALEPVAGSIALLQRVGGYRAFDYVVRLERGRPDTRPVREEVWTAVAAGAPAEQSFAIGTSAYDQGRLDVASQAFARARGSCVDEVAAAAGYNHAVVLGELRRREDAIVSYDEVVARLTGASARPLREVAVRALFNKGVALVGLGRTEEAIAVYDEVVARCKNDRERMLQPLAARALVNKGIALSESQRPSEAVMVYDEVISRFGGAADFELREQTAKAMVNKGVALGALEQSEGAIAVYDDVITRFGGAGELALRDHAAKALVNKSLRLEILGRPDEAMGVREAVVALYGGADEPPLRARVATVLFDMAVVLEGMGRPEEAIAVFDEIVARLDDVDEPELRQRAASALANKALALAALGRPDEAERVYRSIIAGFDDALDPEMRRMLERHTQDLADG